MMQTNIPNSRSRRPTTRTTTGCQTCRRRRIKCDEVKPSCQRCQRAAIDCSYKPQLKWPRQGARMGNNRSRRHRARVDASTQMACSPLSKETRLETFSVDRLEEPIHAMFVSAASCTSGPDDNHDFVPWMDLGMNHLSTDSNSSLVLIPSDTFSLSISSLGDPYQLPNMEREDSMLFHYYVAEMCPQCIVRNGYNKSYRQVILPLVNNSNILLRAILAFTANRIKLLDERFQTIALRHRAAVLQGLQQSLNNKKRTSFSRLEILSTILMLCFFEIYNPRQTPKDPHGLPTRPWMTHAAGVRRLLELGPLESHDSHYEKAVVSFLSQYFASHSVLAFTSLSPLEDQIEIFDHAHFWLDLADRPPEEINPFAGCSNELLKSILVITSRMRQVAQSRSQLLSSLQQTWAGMMAKRLFAMDQLPPADRIDGVASAELPSRHADPTPTTILGKTSEAFRLAAVVLLGSLYPQIDITAHEQTERCLDRLGEILSSGVAVPQHGALGASSYLWPYFVAGCHLQTLDQKASLSRRIRPLFSQNWPSDTASGQILCVLEEVWSLPVGHRAAICTDRNSFLWKSAKLNRHQVLEWV
ncbi:hypothetical protein GCG54_00015578 [Colletotrichum gloeosporioides]|uniref:Zn(2)-C6 fungal-type domain-containing protein n=1 Tax=Colletotrichum gloeosporioides TaxID=474922 RepID=A0A8H4FRL9_COLGL|nr:uncharacterized protein GCG54_00015578 [Colletotrichum gloeosporioides]KAF3812028.1 hypothetical protein GCG54_00015578 [Colletotrichum gloeosporioides]